MKYTRDLVPKPYQLLHAPDVRVPRVPTTRVSYEKAKRLFSISVPAPENASERLDGLHGLGAHAPAAPAPSVWENINTALNQESTGKLVGTAANFYVQHQTNSAQRTLANTQAQTAAMQAQIARERALAAANAPKGGMPGWVIPTAIGGVVVIGAALFFLRK